MNLAFPLLPPKFNFRNVDILEAALSANAALAELNGLVLSIPNYEILLQPLTAREAVASSEIENIFTTTLDLLQAELFPESLPQEQKETLNYKQALMSGYHSVQEKQFLATNQVVEIHSVLEPSKSGIRRLPGTQLVNSLGDVVYTPPQQESEIRELLNNWEDYSNVLDSKLDTLVRMAILHYQFESIHPFYDGNGRTGRILMVLQLVLEQKLRFPVLFLSGYILKHRKAYYEHLQGIRERSEWQEWVLFILKGVEVQSKETSNRILLIKNLLNSFRHEFQNRHPKIYSAEFCEYLFSKAFYSQSDLVRYLKINRKTASKYFQVLLDAKILEFKVVKKEKLYFHPEFLKLLS
jgi:Fic family protein